MQSSTQWHITSFYRFVTLDADSLVALQSDVDRWMDLNGLIGLVILAPEGVNGTVGGDARAIAEFKIFIQGIAGVDDIRFKDSVTDQRPFHRRSVDVRTEIVGLKRPDLVPATTEDCHLSPAEWHAWMASDREKLVIDTRNDYETMAGMFKGAIDPGLKHFSEWGTYLKESELPKDVPILIYCTGGIRCEKAILEMRGQGFEKVYQLRDGILGYLAEYPEGYYDGECFVFDDRVTVGPQLAPTGNFGICPGCGLTSKNKLSCPTCGRECFVCESCTEKMQSACSKRCRDTQVQLAQRQKRKASNPG